MKYWRHVRKVLLFLINGTFQMGRASEYLRGMRGKYKGEVNMMDLISVWSLLLGLIAWILPVMNLMRHKKQDNRNWIALSVMSLSACAISLCLQLINNNYLVQIGDLSALMDTIGTLAVVASILVIVTIILNAITLFVYRGRTAK